MKNGILTEIADKLRASGVPPEFGSDHSRLLIQVYRAVAEGRPVAADRVKEITTSLGIDHEDAAGFLRDMTERDDDNIIGVIGLSQNE